MTQCTCGNFKPCEGWQKNRCRNCGNIRASALKQKPRKPLRAKSTYVSPYKETPKRLKKGESTAKWLRAIPKGTYGSGALQKRLWKLTSDLCRIRDFHKYGTCVATGKIITSWKNETDGGHFVPYATCNGIFKFSPKNVHMQTSASNQWGGEKDKFKYEETLEERYGREYPRQLKAENRDTPLKFSNAQVIEEIEKRLADIALLPEQPDYFARVIMLKENPPVL